MQYADAGNVATDAQVVSGSDIETITVHGEAPHQGGWETFLGGGWLGRTLGRIMDGGETAFVGAAHVFGGIIGTAGIALFSPVIGTAALLAGEPPFQTVGSLLRVSGESVPFGARLYGAGLGRMASGLTGGWIPVPADPVRSAAGHP